MSAGQLKLTASFGERDRSGGRFLSDALLDVYERHEVAASILLRGAEGFGLRHHLRTDRLLTLSEDLPVVSVAVDEAERIGRVADDAAQLMGKGLITLERVADTVAGEATLTLSVGRHERAGRAPAFVAACEVLHRRGVAGATVLLGVDGIRSGRRARARFVGRNSEVPATVVAVGDADGLSDALDDLRDVLDDPITTLQDARVCKRDGQVLAAPPDAGAWQRLTVFNSESVLVDGKPAYKELIRGLREAGLAGATTVRGVWGYHGDHRPHGDRLLQLRRRVPVVTTVVDTPERIAQAFEVADRWTPERGLIIVEPVAAALALAAGERRGSLLVSEL